MQDMDYMTGPASGFRYGFRLCLQARVLQPSGFRCPSRDTLAHDLKKDGRMNCLSG